LDSEVSGVEKKEEMRRNNQLNGKYLKAIGKMGSKLESDLVSYLNSCVHCGLCSESCHYYLSDKSDSNMPVSKVEAVASIYRRYFTGTGSILPALTGARSLNETAADELVNLAFGSCSMCGRCTIHCSIGIDIAKLVRLTRSMLVELDRVPAGLQSTVNTSLKSGNNMGIPEDELIETKRRKRMRVYSVGSLANLITGLLALCFISLLLSYSAEPNGLYIAGTKNRTEADIPDGGEILYSINNVTIRNFDKLDDNLGDEQAYYTLDTSDGIYTYYGYAERDGRNVTIYSENLSVTFILSDMSNSLFVDLIMPIRPIYYYREPYYSTKGGVGSWVWILIKQLAWIALLNIGIGLINLLPMLPLDGGALFRDIAQKATNEEKGKKIAVVMSLICFIIIILNFIPAFFGGMTSLK